MNPTRFPTMEHAAIMIAAAALLFLGVCIGIGVGKRTAAGSLASSSPRR